MGTDVATDGAPQAAPSGTGTARGAGTERILVLWTADASLRSAVVSWASYGPEDLGLEGLTAHQAGSTDEPPYPSVVAALADGWRLVQMSAPPSFPPGAELRTGHLPYEVVLTSSAR